MTRREKRQIDEGEGESEPECDLEGDLLHLLLHLQDVSQVHHTADVEGGAIGAEYCEYVLV